MKKIKYFYNTNSLRYEKLETPLHVKLLRVLGFLAASIVTSLIIVAIAFRYIDSPKEKVMSGRFENMQNNYAVLQDRVQKLQQQMTDLEKRDNNVYRSIFEADPIPDSARVKEMEKKKELELLQGMDENDLSGSIARTLNNLTMRIEYEDKSYNEIEGFVKNKEVMLAATPAIQPVSNKDLSRIASGFGHRIDPVYKTVKMHAGLDFAAPQGTPIYATANGTISVAGNTGNGYGNHVIINHGYGYETLYGHMVKVKCSPGQKIKRGEIIGYVGSTGKSTGPHCHYEVHKNGKPLDPVYFFYNDLTPEQYDRLLKMASASNQSFD
ncbi:M23 family metallopeptidase [Pinibacter soli]|uniref:M23 family metallopeptidase n=1 Tax=Pinibacter soli TaxID=3044211 RepID=A0ABT6RID6_9BACT|nr:M23 family metallopeptidase [Pinibacter soli]MDI3322329.1 M23 family metallopeptidase [Pinibacter soli]